MKPGGQPSSFRRPGLGFAVAGLGLEDDDHLEFGVRGTDGDVEMEDTIGAGLAERVVSLHCRGL